MSKGALCVVCCALVVEGRPSLWRRAVAVQGFLGTLAPLPDGATGVPAAYAPPGPGQAVQAQAGSWAAENLQHIATPPQGQWNSFRALLHCPGGSG